MYVNVSVSVQEDLRKLNKNSGADKKWSNCDVPDDTAVEIRKERERQYCPLRQSWISEGLPDHVSLGDINHNLSKVGTFRGKDENFPVGHFLFKHRYI